MSDESTNPAGTVQVTQNDQVVKEQTGDDFVLDFGEGENNAGIESPAIETGNLEDELEKSEQIPDSVDVNFDSGDLFGEGKDENENLSKNDIEIQDEKSGDESTGNDFNLSLDDNSESVSQANDNNIEVEQNVGDDLNENLENEEVSDNKNDIEESESDSSEYDLKDNSENLDMNETDEQVRQNEEAVNEQENETSTEDLDVNTLDEQVRQNEEAVNEQENETSTEDLDVNTGDEQVGQDEVVADEQENETSTEDLDVNTGDEQVDQNEVVADKQENETSTENSDILLDEKQGIDDGDLLDQDTLEKSSEENDILNLESEDNVKVSEDILDNVAEISDSGDLGEINEENEGELQDDVDENLDVEYKPSLDGEENISEMDEHFEAEDDGGSNEVFGDDLLDDEGEVEKQDENNLGLGIENTDKESDSENNGGNDEVFGGDLLDFDVNQDELQDNHGVESLEGDSKLNLQEKQDVESDGNRNEMEYGLDTSISNQDTQTHENVGELMGFDEVKNVTDVENFGNGDESDSNMSDNHDDIGMSFDSQLDGQNESFEVANPNEITGGSVDNLVPDSESLTENGGEKDMIKNNEYDSGENFQSGSNLDELGVGENGLGKEKDQKSDSIEIKSTLSLDEIMDSELQSGKFSEDKQKSVQEVSSSISTNEGKSKRMFVVVAGIGMFLMAGAVAYLAFPNLTSTENDGGEVVDIQEGQHPVALDVEVERVAVNDSEGEIDDRQDEDSGTLPYNPDELYESLESNPSDDQKVILDFPDPMGGDDSYVEGIEEILEDTDDESLGSDYSTPMAYDWGVEEMSDLDDEQDSEGFLAIEEINKIITSYRNQGDMYYSMAQQNSDNRIYKYAMRVLSLCDEYEERISNGEGLDEESYNKFTKDTSAVLTKLQDYTNDSEIQTVETGNMPDDYDEERQSELRDFVTKRAEGAYY